MGHTYLDVLGTLVVLAPLAVLPESKLVLDLSTLPLGRRPARDAGNATMTEAREPVPPAIVGERIERAASYVAVSSTS